MSFLRNLCRTQGHKFSATFSTFRFMIHFVYDERYESELIFCIWISNCFNYFCWNNLSFLYLCTLVKNQFSTYMEKALFLVSLFHSSLDLYTSVTLSSLLWLFCKAWNQVIIAPNFVFCKVVLAILCPPFAFPNEF